VTVSSRGRNEPVDDGVVSIDGGDGFIAGVTVFSLLVMGMVQPDIFAMKMLLRTNNEIIIDAFFMVITTLHYYHGGDLPY